MKRYIVTIELATESTEQLIKQIGAHVSLTGLSNSVDGHITKEEVLEPDTIKFYLITKLDEHVVQFIFEDTLIELDVDYHDIVVMPR